MTRQFSALASLNLPKIEPARMWVTKEINEFKDDMRRSKDNMIHIGSLATATVSHAWTYFMSVVNFLVCIFMFFFHFILRELLEFIKNQEQEMYPIQDTCKLYFPICKAIFCDPNLLGQGLSVFLGGNGHYSGKKSNRKPETFSSKSLPIYCTIMRETNQPKQTLTARTNNFNVLFTSFGVRD